MGGEGAVNISRLYTLLHCAALSAFLAAHLWTAVGVKWENFTSGVPPERTHTAEIYMRDLLPHSISGSHQDRYSVCSTISPGYTHTHTHEMSQRFFPLFPFLDFFFSRVALLFRHGNYVKLAPQFKDFSFERWLVLLRVYKGNARDRHFLVVAPLQFNVK